MRVPDDSYAMVANGLRIHGVDLDGADVLHSPKLLEFVREHKLLDNADPKDFNFAKAFRGHCRPLQRGSGGSARKC